MFNDEKSFASTVPKTYIKKGIFLFKLFIFKEDTKYNKGDKYFKISH